MTIFNGGRTSKAQTGVIRLGLTVISRERKNILWCTSRTKTPRPTPIGQGSGCRQRRSGNLPRAADLRASLLYGVSNSVRTESGWPILIKDTSRCKTQAMTDMSELRRSRTIRPTDTGCMTWPGTCGSGRAIGTARTNTRLAEAGGVARNPQGPESSYDPTEPGERKRSQRGGSFLCTDQYCSRYMVGTRGKGEISTGTNHLGFRCVMTPSQPR